MYTPRRGGHSAHSPARTPRRVSAGAISFVGAVPAAVRSSRALCAAWSRLADNARAAYVVIEDSTDTGSQSLKPSPLNAFGQAAAAAISMVFPDEGESGPKVPRVRSQSTGPGASGKRPRPPFTLELARRGCRKFAPRFQGTHRRKIAGPKAPSPTPPRSARSCMGTLAPSRVSREATPHRSTTRSLRSGGRAIRRSARKPSSRG